MEGRARTGQLYLNDRHVGQVAIHGWHGPWGVGFFAAGPGFEEFAALFAEWTRVMHADTGPLSAEHAGRLRDIEFRMYALKAKIWIEELRQWRVIDILNIDGELVEWKEGWSKGGQAQGDSHQSPAEPIAAAGRAGDVSELFLG